MRDPIWIAHRRGQDWIDDDILAALDWLGGMIPAADWARRMDAVRDRFEQARARWASGERVPLYDPSDRIAWYAFQARAYAAERRNWFEPEAYRIAPLFRRLGQVLPDLKTVVGAEDRGRTLMTQGRRQPDDGLYELLVAAAYRRAGWTETAFVEEMRGVAKRPDLFVGRGRRSWAAECKRIGRSDYGETERRLGEAMAQAAHAVCARRGASVIVESVFKTELEAVPADYLAERVEAFLDDERGEWKDAHGLGWIRPVDRRPLDLILAHDDLFFGSSRMIELVAGQYAQSVDYSMEGDWTPARDRPLHAHRVGRVSLVCWVSRSDAAQRRKAKHFRKRVREAMSQLPGDRPGVVHVGYEAFYDAATEGLRHSLNARHIRDLPVGDSRLRYVYANYLLPEHVNARDESSALTETTAVYKVGRSRAAEPLPCHLLFSDAAPQPGPFW